MKGKKKFFVAIGFFLAITLVFVSGIPRNEKTKNEINKASDIIVPTNVVYAETLDNIQAEMNKLMSEIEMEMKNNPEVAMQGHPGEFIKNSDSYKNITNLGLKAVKPMYDILYDSRDSGLYEYILAMAVQDITGEKFVYNADYGWKNSMEFRMAYEEKVNNVKFNVERIISDENLSDEEKIEKFKEQGIFAVSFLIKEYNNNDSKISKSVIENSVKYIKSKYEPQMLSERSTGNNSDINENKEVFDSIVELNGKVYK